MYSRAPKILLAWFLIGATPAAAVPVTVVNVIPNDFSNETDQNSEPSIALNPTNPMQAEISAFILPFVPTGSPFFATTNGGIRWTNFENTQQADTTLAWSRSGNVYDALLFAAPPPRDTIAARNAAGVGVGFATIVGSVYTTANHAIPINLKLLSTMLSRKQTASMWDSTIPANPLA
jgi:hypothetical protein